MQKEVEEDLLSRASRIETAIKSGLMPNSIPPVIEVREVPSLAAKHLKDTLIYDPSQDEVELFRELSVYKVANGKSYEITVREMVVETDNILVVIVISYLLIMLASFVILSYFNHIGNSFLWQPFFKTLKKIEAFSLTSHKSIEFDDPDVREFSRLNKELRVLTNKVLKEYDTLKQYTEDVSHELQTPLAIIQAKIDNVVNDAPLSNEQYHQLTSIQKDIKRLTNLNKGLTLLSKIENHQFKQLKRVSLSSILEEKVSDFNEVFHYNIIFNNTADLVVVMDKYLADVLCNNLISNAIKHRSGEGKVFVEVKKNTLIVRNEGKEAVEAPHRIFDRFYKEKSGIKSTGLGLAIVKKICDYYNFTVTYSFTDGCHVFAVEFSEPT